MIVNFHRKAEPVICTKQQVGNVKACLLFRTDFGRYQKSIRDYRLLFVIFTDLYTVHMSRITGS